MKRGINSLVIAFSMYSKLPMPKVDWEEKNMQYAMCFFPLVGVVIAAVMTAAKGLLCVIHMGEFASACILAVIPILITGGIHLDGYLDTVDALSSYQPKEKKLEILKDPHTGAFAIIFAMVYGIVLLGITSELQMLSIGSKAWMVAMGGFLLSRACSGLSVVTLQSAKKNGLLAMFKTAARKRFVTAVMVLWIVLVSILMLVISLPLGLLAMAAAAAMFFLYRHVAYTNFGGVTGDLAGFFLVLCELAIQMAVVIGWKLV